MDRIRTNEVDFWMTLGILNYWIRVNIVEGWV